MTPAGVCASAVAGSAAQAKPIARTSASCHTRCAEKLVRIDVLPVAAGVGQRSSLPLRRVVDCAGAAELGDGAYVSRRQARREDAQPLVYTTLPRKVEPTNDQVLKTVLLYNA
jgi:hypothetical protein